MEESELLKKGYLLKCPQKARAFKKWNSRWFVLYGNSARGRVRLEYYDNEKSWQQERSKRIIPLVHCVSIKPVWNKDYNHVIEIVTSDKTFYLGAGSKDEEKAWFKSLCKAVFGNANRNSIVTVLDRPDPLDMGYHSLDRDTGGEGNLERCRGASFAHSSPQLSKIMGSREKMGEETNINDQLNMTDSSNETVPRNTASSLSCELSSIISFESGFDDGASLVSSVAEGCSTYQVSVRSTIASQESGMVGKYILQITPLSLNLIDIPTQAIVAEWPIQHLRRYGRGRTKFSFESGDKCHSAIGVFTFNTMEGDAIFHQVDTYAKKLSSVQKPENRDKRVSLPAEQFKALNDQRKAKSEGKLVTDKSSLLGSSNFDEISEKVEKINFSNQNTFPSKSRAVTLDAIADVDKHTEESLERPRATTDGNLKINNTEPDAIPYGESTESLLKNPANSDPDLINEKRSTEELANDTMKDEKKDAIQDSKQMEPSFGKDSTNAVDVTSKATEFDLVKEERSEVLSMNDDLPLNNVPTSDDVSKQIDFDPVSTSEVSLMHDTPDNINEKSTVHNNNKVENLPNEDVNNLDETDASYTKTSAETKLVRIISKEAETSQDTDKVKLETKTQVPTRRKLRKQACRNKSFEFGSMSEKAHDNRKQSGSFSSFDYRKYQLNPDSTSKSDTGSRKLQRFTSVKKTVEMYEKLQVVANETRLKGFTLWKKKSVKPTQKPEPFIKTSEKMI